MARSLSPVSSPASSSMSTHEGVTSVTRARRPCCSPANPPHRSAIPSPNINVDGLSRPLKSRADFDPTVRRPITRRPVRVRPIPAIPAQIPTVSHTQPSSALLWLNYNSPLCFYYRLRTRRCKLFAVWSVSTSLGWIWSKSAPPYDYADITALAGATLCLGRSQATRSVVVFEWR